MARAIHLLHYGPRALLTDWLAWPLVGSRAEAIANAGPGLLGDLEQPFMTWFAARARITEDWLAASTAGQYVILGAGLDSFAWRQQADIEVFEVDRPQFQAWKQERVAALRLPIPDRLRWLPLDLEQSQLQEALRGTGVDSQRGVFVSWLGVIPYLTPSAIAETMRQLPPCHLAVAYVPPEEHWSSRAKPIGRHFQSQVRDLGEPWISLFTTDQLQTLCDETGFTLSEDLGASDIEHRYGLPSVHHERITLLLKT